MLLESGRSSPCASCGRWQLIAQKFDFGETRELGLWRTLRLVAALARAHDAGDHRCAYARIQGVL
jgi:hypothetical protein